MSAASRALNTYDIVVLVLPCLCDDGYLKDLLFLQGVNTTWRAVILHSSQLQISLWLTELPAKRRNLATSQAAIKLPVLSQRLIWVYGGKLKKVVGLYSSLSSSHNLYCDAGASCLDMRLVKSNLSMPFWYQAGEEWGRPIGLQSCCNTIRGATNHITTDYKKRHHETIFRRYFIAFDLNWYRSGIIWRLLEVRRGGDSWTKAPISIIDMSSG